MSANLLRSKFTLRFKGLSKSSKLAAWSFFLLNVGWIAVGIGAGSLLLSMDAHWSQPLLVAMVMMLIGTRFRALNNLVHECSHSLSCRDRKTNQTIGKSCALLLLSCFEDYKREHLSHHAHLGDYEHDLDLQGIHGLALHDPLTKRTVLRHICRPFFGLHLPYYLKVSNSDADGGLWRHGRFLLLTLIAISFFFAPAIIGFFLIIPYALVYTSLNYWADCFDHAGIVPSSDDLQASRNLLVPQPIRSLFFPLNDSFHLVHHLFPHIPSQHLSRAHDLLESDPAYSASPNAVSKRVRSQMKAKPKLALGHQLSTRS